MTNPIVSFRRNPDNAWKPLAVRADQAKTRQAVRSASGGAWAPRKLLHRLVGTTRSDSRLVTLLEAHAPDVLSAIRDAQRAPNAAAYAAAFARFNDTASTVLDQVERGQRTTRADAGLYTLLAPVYAMQQVVEQLIVEPQLPNLLPVISLGTVKESGVYLEYVPGIHAAEASWEYGIDGAPVAAGKMEEKLCKLIPFKLGVAVSGRERELHDEMRGQMGAPSWDLFQKRLEEAMLAALIKQGQIVSYGDPDAGVYGLLSDTAVSGITAANVNFDTGTGLNDAGTIIGQVAVQAAAVGFDPRLVCDTIVFDPTSWYNLTGRGVSNTGDSDQSVIGRVFAFRPEIQEITYARELGPDAAVTTALTPKVGATEAARLRGGYNDAGTTKRCMVLMRNDPNAVAQLEGIPISYEALDDRDGSIRGQIRGSSGGIRAFRPETIRIVYL